MNKTLFLSMLKMNLKPIFGFSVASVGYMWLVIWIYPTIAGEGINELLKSLPKELLNLIGMQNGLDSLGDYLAGEYYGLLFLVIVSIYCVMTATRLVARLIDRGSIAYLLATPNSRVKIALTQAAILVFGILMIVFITVAGGLGGVPLISPDLELEASTFIKVNVVGFLLFFAVSGYCFFFSCLLNDEKRVLGISSGITILFFMLHMAGKLSTETDWLLNFTLFSAYKPHEIVSGGYNIVPSSIFLSVLGIFLYAAAIFIFKNRDLPL